HVGCRAVDPTRESRSIAMSKSPGHQKWPQHRVDERRVDGTVTVQIDGDVLAQSRNVIRVDEEEYPPRYYLPRDDVKMDKLERSNTTTECPFKGTAHYFSIAAGDKRL